MCLRTIATTTSDNRPVDNFFCGAFWFDSATSSLRFRHIRACAPVSATHRLDEQFGVTVHGTAQKIDLADSAHQGFRNHCAEIYGEGWNDWDVGTPEAGATYARIDATSTFTFHLDLDEEDPEDNP